MGVDVLTDADGRHWALEANAPFGFDVTDPEQGRFVARGGARAGGRAGRPRGLTAPYVPPTGVVDEAIAPGGEPRGHYRPLLDALGRTDLGLLAAQVAADAERDEVVHGSGDAAHILHFDPVPRVVDAAEWATLAAASSSACARSTPSLEDAAGPRAGGRRGRRRRPTCSTRAATSSASSPAPRAPAIRIGVAGPDIVRAPGRRARRPRGQRAHPHPDGLRRSRARRARRAGCPRPGRPRRATSPARWPPRSRDAARRGARRRRAARRAARRRARRHLSWEARTLGQDARDPPPWPSTAWRTAATGSSCARAGGPSTSSGGARPRSACATTRAGARRSARRSLGPLRAGTVAVVNAFGTGLADDKRTYAYVEELVRFFCGEEPVLRSVPTLDLGRPDGSRRGARPARRARVQAARRLGRPRARGRPARERRRARDAAPGDLEAPADWVAQETVALSTHPTVVDGRARAAARRPAAVRRSADGLMPGGLSRVALARGRPGRQLLAGRRRQGHLGPGGVSAARIVAVGHAPRRRRRGPSAASSSDAYAALVRATPIGQLTPVPPMPQ